MALGGSARAVSVALASAASGVVGSALTLAGAAAAGQQARPASARRPRRAPVSTPNACNVAGSSHLHQRVNGFHQRGNDIERVPDASNAPQSIAKSARRATPFAPRSTERCSDASPGGGRELQPRLARRG